MRQSWKDEDVMSTVEAGNDAEELTPQQTERGRRVAEWLIRGMNLRGWNNKRLALAASDEDGKPMSQGYLGILVNGGYNKQTRRPMRPSEETIARIARAVILGDARSLPSEPDAAATEEALLQFENAGRLAAGYAPRSHAPASRSITLPANTPVAVERAITALLETMTGVHETVAEYPAAQTQTQAETPGANARAASAQLPTGERVVLLGADGQPLAADRELIERLEIEIEQYKRRRQRQQVGERIGTPEEDEGDAV